jgi:hypothetical protein
VLISSTALACSLFHQHLRGAFFVGGLIIIVLAINT